MWSEQLRDFVNWYNNEFKLNGMYQLMETVSEDSPYHREPTVAAHTDMVVMSLLGLQNNHLDNAHARLLALFAAAFHDVGKPVMREEKYSEERGAYYSYSGHELRSARLWQDFYMTNRTMFETRFGINTKDFYTICVMIEKHRPWGIKDMSKITSIFASLGDQCSAEYINLLTADNTGRIQDDPECLKQSLHSIGKYFSMLSTHEFDMAEFMQSRAKNMQALKEKHSDEFIPRLIMPVAQAGAGKSTAWDRINKWDKELNPETLDFWSHSMDSIRANLYGSDATIAFQESIKDETFKSQVQQHFVGLVRERKNIYVDNTNLSAKRRRFYLTEARKHGYYCRALLFPMSLDDAIAQNANRTDKDIPNEVVMQQYFSLSMPMMYSEFDEITFM